MGAIAMRAHQIDVINRDDLTSIWREIGWRGMRTVEPIDVPVEKPGILSQVLDIHRREHRLSDDQLAQVAKVDCNTLADLFPEHFRPPQPHHLRIVSRAAHARRAAG